MIKKETEESLYLLLTFTSTNGGIYDYNKQVNIIHNTNKSYSTADNPQLV
jgi:hypothetical protein